VISTKRPDSELVDITLGWLGHHPRLYELRWKAVDYNANQCTRWSKLSYHDAMSAATSTDPEEQKNVEAVINSPEVKALLDEMDAQEERGELAMHTHEAVLTRLAPQGIRKPEVAGPD
jgi:hypothetical protein